MKTIARKSLKGSQLTCSLLSTEKETMMVWRGDEVITIIKNSTRIEDCPLPFSHKFERSFIENRNVQSEFCLDNLSLSLSLSLSDRLSHTCDLCPASLL
jgi:hypothetical protein